MDYQEREPTEDDSMLPLMPFMGVVNPALMFLCMPDEDNGIETYKWEYTEKRFVLKDYYYVNTMLERWKTRTKNEF